MSCTSDLWIAAVINTRAGLNAMKALRVSCNASLQVEFQGSRVTSDGGLILGGELDERLGFGELIERHLTHSRRGKDT